LANTELANMIMVPEGLLQLITCNEPLLQNYVEVQNLNKIKKNKKIFSIFSLTTCTE
jgi:hypothetical protein